MARSEEETKMKEIVKEWNDNYSPKIFSPVDSNENGKFIDDGKKIQAHNKNDNRLCSRIPIGKISRTTKISYYFELNKKDKKIFIYLKINSKDFASFQSEYEAKLKEKDKSLKFDRPRLEVNENLFYAEPKIICNRMKDFINITQNSVCVFFEREAKIEEEKLRKDVIKQVENGTTPLFKGYEIEARERGLGNGRIDLLLKKKDGTLLAIELKVVEEDGAVEQILRYLRSKGLTENYSKEIKCLIIAPSFSKKCLEDAAKNNIELCKYQIDQGEYKYIPLGF